MFPLLTILLPTMDTKVLHSDLEVCNDSVWTEQRGKTEQMTTDLLSNVDSVILKRKVDMNALAHSNLSQTGPLEQ